MAACNGAPGPPCWASQACARLAPSDDAVVCVAPAGRDALVLANTGAGKSLCYIMPGLLGRGMVLVVSPLIGAPATLPRGA